MGCGPGIGGALMDDLMSHRLWLLEIDNKEKDGEEPDHDIHKLFSKNITKKAGIPKKKGTPVWLAMSIGVFFVGGLFTIASYQVYQGNFLSQLSSFTTHADEQKILADVPQKNVYNNFKLPTAIVPVSYILYLSVDVNKRNYIGVVKIELLCKHNTSQIILHSVHHKLNQTKIGVKSNDNQTISVINHSRNKHNEMLILTLEESLSAGSTYHLLLGFYNNLTEDYNHGIYLMHYKDGAGKKHPMVSVDFEPNQARKAFPCFDEPALKAKWRIILHSKNKEYHTLSNMPVEKREQLPDGTYDIFYEPTLVMSSYLVSVSFTEYVYQEGTSQKGVKIRVYAPVGRLSETNSALKYALYSVDYYSKAFGIAYMLPTLDLFPVAKFSSGAEESWGNIEFSEDSLLLNPDTSSQLSYQWVYLTVSHEIAHQWFGDLVTIKWWNDLWLKESFATYLESLPMGEQYPSWDVSSSVYGVAMTALAYDSSLHTHPISMPDINPNELTNYYDAITYQKGSTVVNMLGRYLGKETLLNGLKIYLKRYIYGSASAAQLWEALSEAAQSINVVDMMNTWVTYPGFPVVNIKCEGNKFVIEQEKFVLKKLSNDAEKNSDSTLWHIPIRIKLGGKILHNLLTTRKGVFDTCNSTEPYKANFGASGYYHVNYVDGNWRRLLELMNRNHLELPAMDRASLLYDLYSLVSFNHVDITLALDFTQYLSKEHHPTCWKNGMLIMNRIRHVFYNHTELKGCVEQYTLEKISPVLDYLNTIQNHTHTQITLIQDLLVYAAMYDMQPLSALMENRFLKWIISDHKEKLPLNTRYQILNAGILRGDVFGFDYVNETRENAKSVYEQNTLLSALSYTKDEKLLKRIVDEAETTLSARAFTYVCMNRHGRHMAWEAVKKYWDSLRKKYQSDTGYLMSMLQACLGTGTSVADLKEAQDFLKKKLGRFEVYVQRAVETITHNIEFTRHQTEVVSWFKEHRPDCFNRSYMETEFTFHDDTRQGIHNLKPNKAPG